MLHHKMNILKMITLSSLRLKYILLFWDRIFISIERAITISERNKINTSKFFSMIFHFYQKNLIIYTISFFAYYIGYIYIIPSQKENCKRAKNDGSKM